MQMLKKKITFKRGIHPEDQKNWSADKKVEVITPAEELTIPLLQHIGVPCTYSLKPKTELNAFELLAEAEKMPAAHIHTPLCGETSLTTNVTLANGRHVPAVRFKTKSEDSSGQELWNLITNKDWLPKVAASKLSAEDIKKSVCNAGVVGQGGAAFPTHIKLNPPPAKKIKELIVNGCECEPYLTADYRMMIEAPQAIIAGALLSAKAVGAEKTVIAVEDNKPQAIESLKNAAADTDIVICEVETKYPMGGEKQLINAVAGREVPTGKLPLDAEVVVINAGTSVSVALAVIENKPLTWRIVSVAGSAISESKNLFVPIGTTYQDLIDYCGGFCNDPAKVLSGGPMMGFALGDLSIPITKGTSGVTILSHADLNEKIQTSCIRCGRCVDSCPLGLIPTKIALSSRKGHLDLAEQYQINVCCECGCCAWKCPAAIPLTQLIRTGKSALNKRRRSL